MAPPELVRAVQVQTWQSAWTLRRTPNRESSMSKDESGFFDNRRAADYLGLSHRTLDSYRVTGAGPAFHRFGNRVRYLKSDLDSWAAERRATTTAEADRLKTAA